MKKLLVILIWKEAYLKHNSLTEPQFDEPFFLINLKQTLDGLELEGEFCVCLHEESKKGNEDSVNTTNAF